MRERANLSTIYIIIFHCFWRNQIIRELMIILRVREYLKNFRIHLQLINSPAGTAVSGMISRDPLSLGTHLIAKLDSLRMGVSYNNYRDYIFSENWYSLFFIITPSAESSDNGNNEYLVSKLEEAEIKLKQSSRSLM
jgi:hypothetical protein